MTPLDFKNLSPSNQSSFLRTKGNLLCSRKTSFFAIRLYAIYQFYVEVYFTYDMDRIEHIHVIEEYDKLDVYLPGISLPSDLV